ncbi:SCO3374 family protein [Streptomyces sp. NPDC047860]|uniref:SCO3374 family protein n=1 Tax=Streptomyces sp. NPDC047860 TaxID=3155743 RepID=UPI0033F17359
MTSSGGRLSYGGSSCGEVRLWYESVLGWPTVPGEPVRLAVGVRFDVLDVPVVAGVAALARLEGSECEGFPVALCGSRMRLLVAAGSAAELPGLLEWLEWGAPLELDLTAVGAGGVMEAPVPAGPSVGFGARARGSSQGAAVWLRPPGQERGAEASLPTLSAMGTRRALGDCDSPPDLVRLVNTVATEIHRVRLRRDSQALAFS